MPRKNRFQFGVTQGEVPKSVATGIALVWVQCKEYRCLAYQNAEGKWVNFYTNKVLLDFVDVIH